MITTQVLIVVAFCITTVVLADLTRRYYITKQEYEYKTRRLAHDDNIIAADGGEEEEAFGE